MFGTTIAAISTPPGKGGVALIRISGAEAASIAEICFRSKSGKPLPSLPIRKAVYGDILKNGKSIDDNNVNDKTFLHINPRNIFY